MELPRDQETRSYRSHAPERPWRTAASRSNISCSSTTTGLAPLTVTCRPKVGPGQPEAQRQLETSPPGLPQQGRRGAGGKCGTRC